MNAVQPAEQKTGAVTADDGEREVAPASTVYYEFHVAIHMPSSFMCLACGHE